MMNSDLKGLNETGRGENVGNALPQQKQAVRCHMAGKMYSLQWSSHGKIPVDYCLVK